MFEWLSQHYVKLIANYEILLHNPSQCEAVDLLHIFTFTLAAVFIIRIALHFLLFSSIKRRYRLYSAQTHPKLLDVYRRAAQKVKTRRPPSLYRFTDENPPVFTIGSIQPSIFLAPSVAEKLLPDELEAVFVHELTHIKRYDTLLIWLLEIFFVSIPALIIQVFAISFVFSVQNSVLALLGALAGLLAFKGYFFKKILFLREISCDDLSVDAIRDPLLLASSLISVWRIGHIAPRYRWQTGLTFAQSFLPAPSELEFRIKRLMDYKRPISEQLIGPIAS
jgi:Zn-dependent protease with chaperone function